MMTSAQVVETSVNITSNSPSQDYTHLDDRNLPTYDMTPGLKPFTVSIVLYKVVLTVESVDKIVSIHIISRVLRSTFLYIKSNSSFL